MNPFSRNDMKRTARNPQGNGWLLAALVVVLAIAITMLKECAGR